MVDNRKNRKIIRPKLLEFLTKAPGSTHYVGDLASGFGVAEQQIRNTIGDLIRTNALPGLEVVIGGRSWTYRPASTETSSTMDKRVFEELAMAKNGDIIIQDQDGNLWRAKELE